VIFIKPNSSISHEIESVEDEVIHFEGEITFLILSGEISGVGFGLDLTKREVQTNLKSKGLPWERAKAFDKSAVFSDFVMFDGNVNELRMELYVNGRLVQSGGSGLMLYKPASLLKEVKRFLSLEDGDLIMTGTPKGVGPISPGEKFTGKIFEGERVVVEGSWVVK
jgi:2-keto-4-pentenoate hydratase/2-oxohepta-3-ene-1,7-dioic acid hydratase in catechol pathway